MLINPDFSQAVELEDLPPGTYKVRVVGCELKQTQKGETRLMWKLQTFGSETATWNNRVIWHGTMTGGKGAGFLKAFVKAATGEDSVGSFDTDQLMGRELLVTTTVGKNQDGSPSGFPEVKAVASLR